MVLKHTWINAYVLLLMHEEKDQVGKVSGNQIMNCLAKIILLAVENSGMFSKSVAW